MKIKDILAKLTEEEQKEAMSTVNSCMRSICCENVKWMEFVVYDQSAELMRKIIKKLAIEFLLPIAEIAREEQGCEITIFCNCSDAKYDDIWHVRVNKSKIYVTINLSKGTRKHLN